MSAAELSVQRRIESEAWDTVGGGGSRPIVELRAALVDLVCHGDAKTAGEARAAARAAVNVLRRLDANARAAVGRAQVASTSDEPELRARIAAGVEGAARTRADIERLEKEFGEEKLAAERRLVYDNFAKVILKKEGRAVLQGKVAEMEERIAEYEEEGRKLGERKAGLKKSFQLVQQSYCDLVVAAEMERPGAGKTQERGEGGKGSGVAHLESGEVETGEVHEAAGRDATMTDV